jgi:hypothetical protein
LAFVLYISFQNITMDRFLEANRILESSLVKLKGSRELPLRKALLVSNAISRAQDVAECAQLSFVNETGSTRRSSRLLASMQSTDKDDTAVLEMDSVHLRPPSARQIPVSPMALTRCSAAKEQDDEVMEFISNSVLSDILTESDSEMEAFPELSPANKWAPSSLNSLSTSKDWPSWTSSATKLSKCNSSEPGLVSPPPSPGKRQHDVAFPGDYHSTLNEQDDTKRLKLTTSCDSNSLSLPGFCEYLSPCTLCSAPLITYMFGKGFAIPSSPDQNDWPVFDNINSTPSTDFGNVSPSKLFPVLAY